MKNKIEGVLSFSGDKSISHRAALFAGIRRGISVFENFNPNKDCMATLFCLRSLGVEWQLEGHKLTVRGRHPNDWKKPDNHLDARNSGTTTRLLSGILATRAFESQIDGDISLRQRPMGRIIDPLTEMGAKIKSSDKKLPLHFYPAPKMKGINYRLPVASAQVKSCILLAGLFSDGPTRVIEKIPTRDHTERMLRLPLYNRDGNRIIESSAKQIIPDLSMTIPGDISSASFFIAAALLLKGSALTIKNVSLNPTRSGILNILKQMGAPIEIEETNSFPEPSGNIFIKYSSLNNIRIQGAIIPNIIDEIPILALIATQSEGRFELRDAKELRFKESDRIRAIVDNLRQLGVNIDEYDDGFAINGPQKLKGGRIETHRDHRIAMTFAIAGLLTRSEIILDDDSCIGVSFPGFYDALKKVLTNE